MPGLDRRIIAQFDHESVIAHVKADIRSDFILAPTTTRSSAALAVSCGSRSSSKYARGPTRLNYPSP